VAAAAFDLSEVADAVTIVGVLAAMVSALVAYRGWRHRTGHWLYIPAPNLTRQDAGRPEFWVFPPQELADGSFGVVIAGALINAGPSDAFSVRAYVEPACDWNQGFELLEATAHVAAQTENSDASWQEIHRHFMDVYPRGGPSIPVLRVGERLDFVVVARLERGNPYLDELLNHEGERTLSCHWTRLDGSEAHGVHADSRTILGRRIVFDAEDLCSPFEGGRRLPFRSSKRGRFRRESQT